MAHVLAPHGVFPYVVAPGFVETDMTGLLLSGPEGDASRAQSPLGCGATAGEVARVVPFLASETPDFITGAIVDVNGPLTCSLSLRLTECNRQNRQPRFGAEPMVVASTREASRNLRLLIPL
jgi:hypothetical protein